MIKIIFGLMVFVIVFSLNPNSAYAEIAGNATINHIIMPAGDEVTAAVSVNIVNPDTTFSTYCEANRLKFTKSDKSLLASLMLAYALNKPINFYYTPNGSALPGISGHGVGTCELINIWF